MNKLKEGFKQCQYTMFHPVNGFDRVKWNNEEACPSAVSFWQPSFW